MTNDDLDDLDDLHDWVRVKPESVIHLWKAPIDAEDPTETATVPSDWYEQNGTPTTKCAMDMFYFGTYIKGSEIKKTGI